MNKVVITRISISNIEYIAYIELNENRDISNFQLYNASMSYLNNVYVARVENILPNINSAFVRISDSKNCYLSLNNSTSCIYTKKNSKKTALCVGDEILVQVIKEAVKTKDPVVSCKLTLHGKYCIITTENISLSVSKKIKKELSSELKTWLTNTYPEHIEHEYGILLRSNSININLEALKTDIDETIAIYKSIINRAPHSTCYSCMYKSIPEYFYKLRSTDMSNIEEIITDQDDINDSLYNEYQNTDIEKKLKFYNDDLSLSTLYNLTGKIEQLCTKKVWLNSGANIIIEQLETLTCIDVNTAKNVNSNKNSILETNLEAANEIIRQLKLRNISGMIIIDFINMKSEEEQNTLKNHLISLTHEDDKTCTFIDITKLGLYELTRKKTNKSLKEILTNN